ncbi:MAG: HPr family phosphocarrier protein [Christensenellaceae bacterium]|jgi:catabolite repression HPr-like protein|nr:HPr family phosphocarrier protein [Christensenellaceae bacterium]
MARKEVSVTRKGGFNQQNAMEITRLASGFRSLITLETSGKKINAKSLMGVLTLGDAGKKVVVAASGADEQSALEAIASYLAG